MSITLETAGYKPLQDQVLVLTTYDITKSKCVKRTLPYDNRLKLNQSVLET